MKPLLAETLSSDSAYFAEYWEALETGDSAFARSLLLGAGDSTGERLGEMAGFLLAWQNFQHGDFAGVPVQLDLGIPLELSDHALYLRASALVKAGQPELSAPFWSELGDDSSSVFSPEALYQLAVLAQKSGDTRMFLDLAERYRKQPSSCENRQLLDQQAAEVLASVGQFESAVDILYAAVIACPATDTANQIRDMLAGFKRTYHVAPRSETHDEIRNELKGLEEIRDFGTGLRRVHQQMQSAEAADNGELLSYYKGRFESGLGRNRDAVASLEDYVRRFPTGEFLYRSYFYLGRSAYLTDQDTMAIATLTEVADQSEDIELAGRALELLGVLYLDRDRPADAETVFRRWETLSRGSTSESDCLWRLGWSLWETQQFQEAALTWQRLFALDMLGGYAPASLYWSARALGKAKQTSESDSLFIHLAALFPYSYYTVIAPNKYTSAAPLELPLVVPSLDELWEEGGVHTKRFCLLAAMRLPELASYEWPKSHEELPKQLESDWWDAQLRLWMGDRIGAMKIIRTELGSYIRSLGERPSGFFAAAYPLDFDPQIVKLSREFNIDPYFIFSLVCQESHYDPNAISTAGAIGLMQLLPATARTEARKLGIPYSAERLRRPDYNLQIGISHVSGLMNEFSGDSVLVLAAYNAGRMITGSWMEEFGNRDRDEFIEMIPYRETRLFIKRNIEHRAAYRRLYPDVLQSLTAAPSAQGDSR